MTTICQRLNQNHAIENYVDRMPTQIWMKSAQGLAVTVSISLIAGSSISAALVAGALAVAATLVEAIARPLIKSIFPDNPFIGRTISVFTANGLVLGAAKSIFSFSEIGFNPASYILVKLIAWLSLNQNFYTDNVAIAEVF